MRCSSCRSDNRKGRKFFAACSGDLTFICSATIEPVLQEVSQLIEQTGAERWRPHVHVERGELCRLAGNTEAARHELIEAHRLFTEIGAPIRAAEVARELAG